ncbi:pilus assembly protein TadG-related protein [Bacillus sp. FJAT-49736]|uniref:pilus assembly protein TadG-related protein n=1 Tax=Bacillus sp. FJAT-49736 TaxID=2833582 RepID=UPI001BCA28AB|nr:pilus assembly protein TadG-related protein [Bacillus sp. FJAT-49736]MBS4175855.1 Tad domain-containing protein [Bacillus sp. FJAT-49736]
MRKLRKMVNNEKGNISLLMIAIMGGMLVLFVFILNLSKALAVKEQANTTAQQASLAATSVIYDHINTAIDLYDLHLLSLPLEPPPILLSMKVSEYKSSLAHNFKYRDYSANEINMEAIDLAIKSELSEGYDPLFLKGILESNLTGLVPSMISVAREVIKENHGNLEDAEMRFKDNRIYIKASNEYKATNYDKLLEGMHRKLFQESSGPEIDFLGELSIWNNTKILLREKDDDQKDTTDVEWE